MSNATTFASFNGNFGLTLIGTHEPEYRSLNLIVARTTGKPQLCYQFEAIHCFSVISIEVIDSGWVVYIVDDVGKPTKLVISITYDELSEENYHVEFVNYERKWN